MKIFGLSLLLLLASHLVFGQHNYKKLADGIMVYPLQNNGTTAVVQLTVVNEYIIRVTASPDKLLPGRESLVVLPQQPFIHWQFAVTNDKLMVTTAALKAVVDVQSGAVSFEDINGTPILAERKYNGRLLEPVVFEGKSLYRVKQTFETDVEDAYYGLGQHQEDVFNYKGKQVVFFQNNTQVAIPFLISKKNYGILWDNYSYSKVGDTRPFRPLSGLQLFDKNGAEGWLTASYANDRNNPQQVTFVKAESEISYPYVNDSKQKLPAGFTVEKGSVTWEGSIACEQAGTHQLKVFYAGYIKIWVDGVLLFDKWRQAWNPGVGTLQLQMQSSNKYKLKMEWIPDGGESYLDIGYLSPAAPSDKNAYSFDSEAGRAIDYYFVYGKDMDAVISGYRSLTGKAVIMPKWAMGFWQSRERYKTQDEILQTAAEFRKRKIPLDNIVLDWSYWKEDQWGSQEFDEKRFPDPEAMVKKLHNDYNTQVMISVWPKFYEGIKAYEDFNAKGWLYKRNIADRQKDWIAQGYTSTFYDAFSKDAREGFWKLIHDKIFTKGFDAWWMDASEPDILSNVSPERRKAQMQPTALGTAAEYMNAYPLQNAKGIYEGQRGMYPNQRVFLLTRSGFAGSQRYAAAIWSGDIASRWEDMKAQISAGLNFSLSGLPYWTMDIGGFSVERRYEKPNAQDLEEWRELNTRWFQFGAFVPLFRAHGQFPFREIYNIAPDTHEAYKSMLYYNRLRYKLMPYIYSMAGAAYHNNYTIMRALVMDFAADKNVADIGDQFMLGSSLLVNPVYQYKATTRNVYLPQGQGWYDAYNGTYYTGGQNINAAAPYGRMPLFIKEGTVLVTGPDMQYVSEKPVDPLTVYVYTGKDGSFTLYEDENANYNYEKGQYAQIVFSYNDAGRILTIANREGTFKGMLPTRNIHIIVVNKDTPAGFDKPAPEQKKITYSGKKLTIRLL